MQALQPHNRDLATPQRLGSHAQTQAISQDIWYSVLHTQVQKCTPPPYRQGNGSPIFFVGYSEEKIQIPMKAETPLYTVRLESYTG